jgi:hypothetical protein
MIKYDVKTITTEVGELAENHIKAELNELAKLGWRLIQYVPQGIGRAIFIVAKEVNSEFIENDIHFID